MDEYSRLSRNASVGVHGYVMCFSINSRQSFEKIRQINESLLNMLGDAPDVPRILVGSMSDLEAKREVSSNEGQKLADLWNVPYMECSSKRMENIPEVFHTLIKEIEKDEGLLGGSDVQGCVLL
jgi:Ras family protein